MFIEFIIPTFNRTNPLVLMLTSLMVQSNPNWKAHVLIDNNEKSVGEDIVKSFNDDRIYYTYMDKRYNDWGHTLREKGKQESNADYIIMTGDDNYYVPVMVSSLLKIIEEENRPGLIYWDMVHSHYSYHYFECKPFINQIDIGAFAIRNDFAKQIKLGTMYAADGFFIQEYIGKFPDEKKIKINKVLYVHN
jgi:hypothetical protein